jgi:hypothetical protein
MDNSTKLSMYKRLSYQPTPSFIGASFTPVLCIRDGVGISSSPSVLLFLKTMDKVPYMVGGLRLWINFWFNGQH